MLRAESEEAQAKVEELQARIKVLEQENLSKEQEIVSLTHRNSLLEEEVEKLELTVKDAKSAADSGAASSSEVENLQRKVQLLEDEAEEADKNLRETNEKYYPPNLLLLQLHCLIRPLQAPSHRRQGGTLRAQGCHRRGRARPVGEEVRGGPGQVQACAGGDLQDFRGDWSFVERGIGLLICLMFFVEPQFRILLAK